MESKLVAVESVQPSTGSGSLVPLLLLEVSDSVITVKVWLSVDVGQKCHCDSSSSLQPNITASKVRVMSVPFGMVSLTTNCHVIL